MSKLRKPSKAVKRSVADPSDVYNSLKPLWKRSRSVLNGQAHTKAHDEFIDVVDFKNLLLPFSPSMNQQQYEFFKAEAELPGLTAQYCKVLISALLRKQSQLNLPDDVSDDVYDWIEKDFTLDGQSLFNFLDSAIWEELQTSRAWVYVDMPSVSDTELEMMTPEERLMVAPYPVILRAENVINVQTNVHPVTRQKTLTRMVTRHVAERYEVDNPWHPNYVDAVVDHFLDSDGYLVINYYEKRDLTGEVEVVNGDVTQEYHDLIGEQDFVLVNTVYPQKFGVRLDRIPAWPLNGQVEPVEPVLMPLIDREISLYNKISRRNHLLYGAATYTPVVQSDMTDEDFEELVNAGLGSWLRVRKDESISVLDTPTGALVDMDRAIQATVEEMAKMGIRMLSPEQAASGVALEIRNASQTAQLGTLNAKISGTMDEVIAFMINWRYNTDYNGNDIEFKLSSDFSPMVGGEGSMRLITEWYQSGIIPRSTFLSVAKYNDFLPMDYDDEQAIEDIQTDSLINLTPDNEVIVEE